MQLGQSFSDKEFNIQKKQFSEILQKNNFSINNSKVSSNSSSKVISLIFIKRFKLSYLSLLSNDL